jgi:hypothetical protein
MIADGDIRYVDVVRDELSEREDDVHAWAKLQEDLFLPLTEDVQTSAKDPRARIFRRRRGACDGMCAWRFSVDGRGRTCCGG